MASESPIRYYVVDAFAERPLKGNPAAVCLLYDEREEQWLQAIAQEFNLSATCYVTRLQDDRVGCSRSETGNGHADENGSDPHYVPKYRLRWFAPATELNICGHGTIGSAHVLFSKDIVKGNKIAFHTKSRILLAERIALNCDKNGMTDQQLFSIRLTFPLIKLVETDSNEKEMASHFADCTHCPINMVKMAYEGELIVEYSSGEVVANLKPSIDEIKRWPGRGVVFTGAAPEGSGFDFYSRFFCPNLGMAEDPVCGSVHCGLAPYWSKKLGKSDLKAYMASARGGALDLHVNDEKQEVFIQGRGEPVMEGTLHA